MGRQRKTGPLTPREIQVLKLVSEGLTSSKIADKMDLRDSTVNYHLCNVYRKLEVHSRLQAVIAGVRLGLIKFEVTK